MPNLSRRSTKFLSASAAKTLKPTNVSIEPISIVFRSILSSITITIPSCVILCAMNLPPQFGSLREIRQHLSGGGPARVEDAYLAEPECLARRVAAGGHEAGPPGIVNQLIDLVIPCRVTVDAEPVRVGEGTDQQYLGRAARHRGGQAQLKMTDRRQGVATAGFGQVPGTVQQGLSQDLADLGSIRHRRPKGSSNCSFELIKASRSPGSGCRAKLSCRAKMKSAISAARSALAPVPWAAWSTLADTGSALFRQSGSAMR